MKPIPPLDVFDLAARGGAVRGVVAVAALPRLTPSLREPVGELSYRYRGATDGNGRLAGELSMAGDLVLTCDRCNGRLDYRLDAGARFFFVRSERELEALLIDPDSDSDPLVGSTAFDLAALLEDEAILALPLSPRHVACPAGAAPAQAAEPKPHPFADLAALKRKG